MSTIATKLATIATLLCTAIGVFVAREARPRQIVWLGTRVFAEQRPAPRLPSLPQPVWALLCDRLARLATRFQVLFDRWQSNTLPRPRRQTPGRTPAATAKRPPTRLPRAHAWVNHRIPEAAPPSGRLEALLHDPDTRAFVQAAPQAGRLLRPLCQALGLPQPDWLRLPRRPRRPPPAPSPPAPGALPPAPDRPLQPYVRAAARAWRDPTAPRAWRDPTALSKKPA